MVETLDGGYPVHLCHGEPCWGGQVISIFKLIRIDTHVGISPSALSQQLNRMETLLPLFQNLCESNISAQSHKAVVAIDETFFGAFLIIY